MADEESPNEILTGFGLLRDMTKEALIEEIAEHQRQVMQDLDMEQLRVNVIEIRVGSYKRRLAEEAGMALTMFGYANKDDNDN